MSCRWDSLLPESTPLLLSEQLWGQRGQGVTTIATDPLRGAQQTVKAKQPPPALRHLPAFLRTPVTRNAGRPGTEQSQLGQRLKSHVIYQATDFLKGTKSKMKPKVVAKTELWKPYLRLLIYSAFQQSFLRYEALRCVQRGGNLTHRSALTLSRGLGGRGPCGEGHHHQEGHQVWRWCPRRDFRNSR